MTNWQCSALVICPYYLRENNRFVVCEGICQSAEMVWRFTSAQEKIVFLRSRCVLWDYKELCPWAAYLSSKVYAGEKDGNL